MRDKRQPIELLDNLVNLLRDFETKAEFYHQDFNSFYSVTSKGSQISRMADLRIEYAQKILQLTSAAAAPRER